MRKFCRFLLIMAALLYAVLPFESILSMKIDKNRYSLVIPCQTDREKCSPYFRNMLRYLRTFTTRYKISQITHRGTIKALFIEFDEGDLCRKYLTRAVQDLKYLDVHIEHKFKDQKNYWLLYNLNHRMIMACIN